MNVGVRSNKMSSRKNDEEKTASSRGSKSERFSRQMISDIFFIERLEKKYVKELFYTEKDIIGFQIDAMRKGDRKARRNREQRQVARSKQLGWKGHEKPTRQGGRHWQGKEIEKVQQKEKQGRCFQAEIL